MVFVHSGLHVVDRLGDFLVFPTPLPFSEAEGLHELDPLSFKAREEHLLVGHRFSVKRRYELNSDAKLW